MFPDYNLPYFYNLSLSVILGISVFNRIAKIIDYPRGPLENTVFVVGALPAAMAAYYFFEQYQERRELSLRMGLFILMAVQVFSQFIHYFLR